MRDDSAGQGFYWRGGDGSLPIQADARFDDLLDEAVLAFLDREALVYRADAAAEPVRLRYRDLTALAD